MAGQIISRGERTWLVRVFLGRDSHTGKRRYHNHTIRGTKKDAQTYLNGVLREMDLGTFVEPSSSSVNEYLDEWLRVAAKPRLIVPTYEAYEKVFKIYIRPTLGSIKLKDLKPLHIQSLYTGFQERGLSPKTIRYVHSILASALNQAVKWRMIPQSPTSLVDLPKLQHSEMRALTAEEATRFLQATIGDRFGVMFELALTTGMRPEEYLGLQWKDIDLQRGVLTVQRALKWTKKGWYFGDPKTSRSYRNITFPKTLVKKLVEHKRKQAEERLKAGPQYQNLDLVFATYTGGPLMRDDVVRRHFRPVLKKAGLSESMRLYDLRHSCATLLLLAGENVKVVSERLGHSSVVLTLDIYAHVLPSMQQAASDKLETLLFGTGGTL